MAITNHERIGKAMDLLMAGLAPFVEREFREIYKESALAQARRFMGEDGFWRTSLLQSGIPRRC
jgi:hypothetical protein